MCSVDLKVGWYIETVIHLFAADDKMPLYTGGMHHAHGI